MTNQAGPRAKQVCELVAMATDEATPTDQRRAAIDVLATDFNRTLVLTALATDPTREDAPR